MAKFDFKQSSEKVQALFKDNDLYQGLAGFFIILLVELIIVELAGGHLFPR